MVKDDFELLNSLVGMLQLKKYREPGRYDARLGMRQEPPSTPAEYFISKYPALARTYGPPILEHVYGKTSGLSFTGALAMNEDFFASLLGGDPSLGHQVVYYVPEQQWYFLDVRFGYFVPTTEDKLVIFLSQHLIHCAEDLSPGLVDVGSLFIPMRNEDSLKSIVRRGRALLAADRTFFESPTGYKRRCGEQILDPALEPPHKLFIREVIVPKPQAILTIDECYDSYNVFCEAKGFIPAERKGFKGLVAALIREDFGLGVRNDIRTKTGRWTSGWKGLRPRQDVQQCVSLRNN